MKKLILLLTICVLTSCTEKTTSPFIVTGIANCINCSDDYYIVTLNNQTNLFTRTKYNIGDTLK